MNASGTFDVLAVALGLGLGTLGLRLVFGELRGRVAIGAGLRAALDWLPVAALGALVFPAFVTASGAGPAGARFAAALATCAVTWKTRNLLLAVAAGMASYWTVGALS